MYVYRAGYGKLEMDKGIVALCKLGKILDHVPWVILGM